MVTLGERMRFWFFVRDYWSLQIISSNFLLKASTCRSLFTVLCCKLWNITAYTCLNPWLYFLSNICRAFITWVYISINFIVSVRNVLYQVHPKFNIYYYLLNFSSIMFFNKIITLSHRTSSNDVQSRQNLRKSTF